MLFRRLTAPLVLGLLAALALACAEPEPPTDPALEETPVEDEIDVETVEADLELRAQLEKLQDTIEAARQGLQESIDAGEPAAANEALDGALDALLASDAGDVLPSDLQPLLPSQTVDRTESSSPDVLSETLSLAQDLGGTLARDTVEVLTDTIAGDLGAWQRDPAGMVELARSTGQSSTDVGELEAAVLSLDGEGTRALAWVFAAQDAADLQLVDAAAERSQAHLSIIATSVDDLLEVS